MRLLQGFQRRAHIVAVGATLLIGSAVTIGAWRTAVATVEAAAQREFDLRVADVRDTIRGRMLLHAQILRGGAGLLAGSNEVSRRQWRDYVEALQIELHYPGIVGIGVAHRVSQAERAQREADVRADGFPDYRIHPVGPRHEFMAITAFEPLRPRDAGLMGFDIYSDPPRRTAMQRATDTGEPAITPQVRIRPEQEEPTPGAFVMYLAFYRPDAPRSTVEERRAALAGFVFARFRTREVMSGVLGTIPNVRIQIFDGLTQESSTLLYDSAPMLSQLIAAPHYEATTQVLVQDRAWTVRTTSLPEFERNIDRTGPHATLAAGLALTVMLATMVSFLMTLRGRAIALARRMTGELRESREQLSLALEGSNLALFDYDVRYGTVTLSERWNVLLGGSPQKTTTTITELENLVHPDDLPRVRQGLRRALKDETPFYDVEHRVRTHDGSWKWVSSHAKVTERDPQGRAVRITGTNDDITERKTVDHMKNEFIGTVSHELRTPLTALMGSIALLKEEYGEQAPPDAATFIDMAYQNSERLAALVNDILDLEKVEAGRLELDIGRVELKAFIEQAVALNAPYATRYQTRFDTELAASGLAVEADYERLMQVVTNLLSNAAKYSPAGEPVLLRACRHDDHGRIEVIDRGPGIPEEFRERIFGKFAQATLSESKTKGGTGLGLAISKAITEAMGGRIGYDSTGRGALFYVELPLAG